MSYLFSGRLRVYTCGGSLAPLTDATVKLYRRADDHPSDFAVHSEETVSARDYALVAQGRTDREGEFRIDIREKSVFGHRGSTHPYDGEPFVVDVVTRGAYGIPRGDDVDAVQFTVAAVSPEWGGSPGNHVFRWERDVPEAEWRAVRQALDFWTIVGRVVGARAGGGLNVMAFDADLLQDDLLGTATTDAEGRFRIDYPGSAFRQTPVPGVSFERGGPEIYFRIEAEGGAVVYAEPKSRGNKQDRADAPNCFVVEIDIDAAAE
jgi:hypothetical protein